MSDDIGEPILANGQRWQGENKKCPHWDYKTTTWDWHYNHRTHLWVSAISEKLFNKLRKWMKCSPAYYLEYPARIAAEAALADALEAVRMEEACQPQ